MYKMICALVAPEHQGSDLLLRTNCVLWILIILFASLAWHGFVIYPFLEAAEEEKNLQRLQQTTLSKQTELLWIYCIVMQQWYFPSTHFHRFSEKWKKKRYLLSNSGTLTGVHMCKITSRFQSCEMCWNQTANMLSEAPRTSGWCKSVSAHLPSHGYSLGNSVHFCYLGRISL